MARLFDATSEIIVGGTGAVPTTGSFFAWWYPTFAQSDSLLHIVFDLRNDGSNVIHLFKGDDNALYGGWVTAGTDYRASVDSAGYTLNQNAWNHIGMTWDDTSNDTIIYLNGSSVATASTLVTFASTGSMNIGNVSGQSWDARGRLAEVFMVDYVLNTNQISALNAGASVLHTLRGSAFNLYMPLHGVSSPEPDFSGNGENGTVTGATQADHVPTALPFGLPSGWHGAFGAPAAGLDIAIASYHYRHHIGA